MFEVETQTIQDRIPGQESVVSEEERETSIFLAIQDMALIPIHSLGNDSSWMIPYNVHDS